MTAQSHRLFRLPGSALAVVALAGLCVAQTPALPDGAARVIKMTGQVSVMRDTSAWALNVGQTVQPQQVVLTGPDGYAVFQLSDGSTFEVFPKAHVVFRNNRGDWRDLLELYLGKVRVQIQHLGGVPNPNKVRTPTAVISVRGTVFDVDVEDAESTTLVLVEEGRVDVRHLLEPGPAKILDPGDWVRVFKNQPLQAKFVDRGAVLQHMMRAASDAMNQIILRAPRPGTGGTTTVPASTGTASGDKSGTPAPSSGSVPPPPPPGV